MPIRKLAFVFFAAGYAALAAHADDLLPFHLSSPVDYQIFQRKTRDLGVIKISGKLPAPNSQLVVRLFDRQTGLSATHTWSDLPSKSLDGYFSVEKPVRPGGWYTLTARVMQGRELLAETTIEHVGVGEIFIVAGQSNASNHGSEKQQPQSGLVSTFDGANWRIANDPQPGATGEGGSFMPAFGDAMAAKFHVPIGIVACGTGSTSVREWLPRGTRIQRQPTTGKHVTPVGDEWEVSGVLFEKLAQRLDAFGPRGVRAILWHQGESDAGQARAGAPAERQITGEQYRGYMEQLIRATKKRAGWDVPWFTAVATYHSEDDPADEEFRAAQKALWQTGLALEGPDTDKLRAGFRSGVHFNANGLREHGGLWAAKVSPWLEAQLKTKSIKPQ